MRLGEDSSLEFLLRRVEEVSHRGAALVHKETRGKVREERNVKEKC